MLGHFSLCSRTLGIVVFSVQYRKVCLSDRRILAEPIPLIRISLQPNTHCLVFAMTFMTRRQQLKDGRGHRFVI